MTDNRCNTCNKGIVKVIVETTTGEKILGYIRLESKERTGDLLRLFSDEEEILVYRLNDPKTGVPTQVGYVTLVYKKLDLKSIQRFSDTPGTEAKFC